MGSVKIVNRFSDIPNVGPVVIGTFAMKWCEECAAIFPGFEKLSVAYPSVTFLAESIDVCFLHEHSVFPQFRFKKDGVYVANLGGFDVREMKKRIALLSV